MMINMYIKCVKLGFHSRLGCPVVDMKISKKSQMMCYQSENKLSHCGVRCQQNGEGDKLSFHIPL
jgi:hypothetical protein